MSLRYRVTLDASAAVTDFRSTFKNAGACFGGGNAPPHQSACVALLLSRASGIMEVRDANGETIRYKRDTYTMAMNYVSPGDNASIMSSPADYTTGDVVILNSMIGIAAGTAATGDPIDAALNGVFKLKKVAGDVFAPGVNAYWDAAQKLVTHRHGDRRHAPRSYVLACDGGRGHCSRPVVGCLLMQIPPDITPRPLDNMTAIPAKHRHDVRQT